MSMCEAGSGVRPCQRAAVQSAQRGWSTLRGTEARQLPPREGLGRGRAGDAYTPGKTRTRFLLPVPVCATPVSPCQPQIPTPAVGFRHFAHIFGPLHVAGCIIVGPVALVHPVGLGGALPV